MLLERLEDFHLVVRHVAPFVQLSLAQFLVEGGRDAGEGLTKRRYTLHRPRKDRISGTFRGGSAFKTASFVRWVTSSFPRETT